ncbi:glycosyltransferase family 2 protein [Candidatus Nitrososphaera sp. FF02]|uniref:glycosyltransferase family 2 protein n=1 Tax=Candidatus Nitrososphaera sp. FF02 TaxID=3398226 RepID=UPI0039EA40C6
MLLSIVIPTLNEEEGISSTITGIPFSTLSRMGHDVELLVVDGNSHDKTREIAAKLGAKVILEARRGYGRAYKTGFEQCSGQIIITLDADGTYPAEKIPEYVSHFQSTGLNFLTINRFGRLEDGAMSFSHKIGNKILSATLRLLFGLKIKDSQSGMWILRKDMILSNMPQSDGMGFSEEIKIIAFKDGNAAEIDGEYRRRLGEVKLQTVEDGVNNLRYLLKLRTTF